MQNNNVDPQETVNGDDHDQRDSNAEPGSSGNPHSFASDRSQNNDSDDEDESLTDSQHDMESQFVRRIQELRAQLASSGPSYSKVPHMNQGMSMPSFRSATGRKSMHRMDTRECAILQRAHDLTTSDLC